MLSCIADEVYSRTETHKSVDSISNTHKANCFGKRLCVDCLLLLTSATERPTGRLGCAGEALAFFSEKNERAQRPFSPLSPADPAGFGPGRHQISRALYYKAERHRGKLAVARADCFAALRSGKARGPCAIFRLVSTCRCRPILLLLAAPTHPDDDNEEICLSYTWPGIAVLLAGRRSCLVCMSLAVLGKIFRHFRHPMGVIVSCQQQRTYQIMPQRCGLFFSQQISLVCNTRVINECCLPPAIVVTG
jgi:hypothetical protein